jgi:hypothetical protein
MSGDLAAELLGIAEKLRVVAGRGEADDVVEPLRRLLASAEAVGRAWSCSPVGYHSRVYYTDFQKPPPGARFSKEWGFMDMLSNEMRGDWVEYPFDAVIDHIREEAGNPDLGPVEQESGEALKALDTAKGEIDSVLATFEQTRSDDLVHALREQATATRAMTQQQAQQAYGGTGQVMTRDMQALGEGIMLAPHLVIMAKIVALKAPFSASGELANVAARAGDHITRLARAGAVTRREGNRVFIGHGRSLLWRELKDFLQDRLGLSYDEFNRVPVAGLSNIGRLAEMLDGTAIALLVLTAEDEMEDGTEVARQNVVHEAGLFQGRLGFNRAIVLLEAGCDEFSNIQGLGQLRFPKGDIKAVFEGIREVLEREGITAG